MTVLLNAPINVLPYMGREQPQGNLTFYKNKNVKFFSHGCSLEVQASVNGAFARFCSVKVPTPGASFNAVSPGFVHIHPPWGKF